MRLHDGAEVDGQGPSTTLLDRIAKHEANVVRLTSIREEYIRRAPLYAKGFVGLAIAGFACFAFGALPGVWGSISATFVAVAGYAMLGIRIRELEIEIETLRTDIERMRQAGATVIERPASGAERGVL